MKVYVTIPDYGYDGYGEPVGIYTTKARAEAAAATYRGTMCDVVEYELDSDGALYHG